MAAPIAPSRLDPATGLIRADAREAADLYELLVGLGARCAPPAEAPPEEEPGLRIIALSGNPGPAEIRRVTELIEVYNSHRRVRAASGPRGDSPPAES